MRINTLSEIKKNLKKLKLKKGASCLLHSSIVGMGLIKNFPIKNIPKKIFDLVFQEIGKNGTLSALTPYYDYGLKFKKFDDVFDKFFITYVSTKVTFKNIFVFFMWIFKTFKMIISI